MLHVASSDLISWWGRLDIVVGLCTHYLRTIVVDDMDDMDDMERNLHQAILSSIMQFTLAGGLCVQLALRMLSFPYLDGCLRTGG